MPPKRKADASERNASKKRKAITLEVKVDIIKRSERGETPTNIGKQLADFQLPKVESVAFLIQYQNRELELISTTPITVSVVAVADSDADADTVILGAGGDVGNLDDFHDDQ